MVKNEDDFLRVSCLVNDQNVMPSCRCHISHAKFGSVTCPSIYGHAINPTNELQDCKVFISPKFSQYVLASSNLGGYSPYCQSHLDSGTGLVIPIHTIHKKTYQKGSSYYYTPTWMVDAPEWSFPMYSVGENLLALCKAHLKDSHLSCDCTIYGMKELNQLLYCPSRLSVPLTEPIDLHASQHCELYLPIDQVFISNFKTAGERLDSHLASSDFTWPCSSSILITGLDPSLATTTIELPPNKSTSKTKKRQPPLEERKQRQKETAKARATRKFMQSALDEGLDTSLDSSTLRDQLKELKWQREIMAKASSLDPEERGEFIEKRTKAHQTYLKIKEKSSARSKLWYEANRDARISKITENRKKKSALRGDGSSHVETLIELPYKKSKSRSLDDTEPNGELNTRRTTMTIPGSLFIPDDDDDDVFENAPFLVSPVSGSIHTIAHSPDNLEMPFQFDHIFNQNSIKSPIGTPLNPNQLSPTVSEKELLSNLFEKSGSDDETS